MTCHVKKYYGGKAVEGVVSYVFGSPIHYPVVAHTVVDGFYSRMVQGPAVIVFGGMVKNRALFERQNIHLRVVPRQSTRDRKFIFSISL